MKTIEEQIVVAKNYVGKKVIYKISSRECAFYPKGWAIADHNTNGVSQIVRDEVEKREYCVYLFSGSTSIPVCLCVSAVEQVTFKSGAIIEINKSSIKVTSPGEITFEELKPILKIEEIEYVKIGSSGFQKINGVVYFKNTEGHLIRQIDQLTGVKITEEEYDKIS